MLDIRPDAIATPNSTLLNTLQRVPSLGASRALFMGALAAVVAGHVVAVRSGASTNQAAFVGLLTGGALTAASAPILAKAYHAFAVQRLMAWRTGGDRLETACKLAQRRVRAAALALVAVSLALNFIALWAYGSTVLHVHLWDAGYIRWLRLVFNCGLAGLIVADRAVSTGSLQSHHS